MNESKIPSVTEVLRVLSEIHQNNYPSIPTSLIAANLSDIRSILDSAVFGYSNPFPTKYLVFSAPEIRKQKSWYTENQQVYQDNHNLWDEFYHYITNYSELPYRSRTILIERLKHPSIVYSQVTLYLVNAILSKATLEDSLSFLKEQSSLEWLYTKDHGFFPKNHWQEINSILGYQPLGAIEPFRTKLRNLQQQLTTGAPANFLKNYSTKATETFSFQYGKKPAYTIAMGVELELDNLTNKAIPILKKHLDKHAIFKKDGSVSKGVEICTAPATLDIHKEVFDSFFEESLETGLLATNSCGLHVHVDRKKLKPTQIAKILHFMNNEDNNIFIEQIAGRQANNYCEREDHTWETVIHKTTGDKYKRVNLAPRETIEFRLFASTLDKKQFNRCLEFVQAILDYTRTGEHDCSIKDMLKKDNFIKYTNKNKQFYPTLNEYFFPKTKDNSKGVPF